MPEPKKSCCPEANRIAFERDELEIRNKNQRKTIQSLEGQLKPFAEAEQIELNAAVGNTIGLVSIKLPSPGTEKLVMVRVKTTAEELPKFDDSVNFYSPAYGSLRGRIVDIRLTEQHPYRIAVLGYSYIFAITREELKVVK